MRHKRGESTNVQIIKKTFCGKPIWNTGEARRSRPLRRDFPREAGAATADAKLKSSTMDRLGGLAGRLET